MSRPVFRQSLQPFPGFHYADFANFSKYHGSGHWSAILKILYFSAQAVLKAIARSADMCHSD
jgi:hypothetical protein